jgi:hypothetical protein
LIYLFSNGVMIHETEEGRAAQPHGQKDYVLWQVGTGGKEVESASSGKEWKGIFR